MYFETRKDLGKDPRQWEICVVLPTKDEAAALAQAVQEIRFAFRANSLKPPILMITDDSHDETRKVARGLGLHVVNGEGKGLGFAMRKGLRAALAFDPDVIVSMDGDGQSDPREILRFLKPIATAEADLVIGSRFREKGAIGYRYPWLNRLGVTLLAWFLRRVTGLSITDSHGGLRAMRPEVVRSLEVIGSHTYVQEAIIDAHKKGYRVVEVPSCWRRRRHGRSRVVGSIPRYIMYTLPVLIVRSGSHVRWPFRLAFGLLFLAAALGLWVVWQAGFALETLAQKGTVALFLALLVMASAQLLTIGFLTDLLGMIKLQVDRVDLDQGRDAVPVEERRPTAG